MANAQDRRTFLSLLGLGIGGLKTAALDAAQTRLRLGFYVPVGGDLAGTFRTLAAIGYRDVDLGLTYRTGPGLAELRRLLDQQALTAASRHVPMSMVFSNWRTLLNDCRVLGNRHAVCEVPTNERATMSGYAKVVDLLNPAAKLMQSGGVQLAVRLHRDDLTPRAAGAPFDFMLARTNPLVKFQLDQSIFATAGRDMVEDLTKHRGRFASLHITNGDAANVPQILTAAGESGVQHFFVADENPEPSWDRAKETFAQLSALKL